MRWAVFDRIKVEERHSRVEELKTAAYARTRARFSDASRLGEDAVIAAFRSLARTAAANGSANYVPANEALIARVMEKGELATVNTMVDLANVASIQSGCPCGVYDLDRTVGDLVVGVGSAREEYWGICREVQKAQDKILVRDDKGPFSVVTADADRTKVTLDTHRLLILFYEPRVELTTELGNCLEWVKGGLAGLDAKTFTTQNIAGAVRVLENVLGKAKQMATIRARMEEITTAVSMMWQTIERITGRKMSQYGTAYVDEMESVDAQGSADARGSVDAKEVIL